MQFISPSFIVAVSCSLFDDKETLTRFDLTLHKRGCHIAYIENFLTRFYNQISFSLGRSPITSVPPEINTYGFLMISRDIEVNIFAQIPLTLKVKFGEDLLEAMTIMQNFKSSLQYERLLSNCSF